MHGGMRPGAGRPRGQPNRKTLEAQVQAALKGDPIPEVKQRASLILPDSPAYEVHSDPDLPINKGVTPLEFMLLTMNMECLPLGTRLGAAIRALPYTTKKYGLADGDQRCYPDGSLAPLGFVLANMEDPNVTFDLRHQAAVAAAPYLHARQDTGTVGVKALKAKAAGSATNRFLEEAKARKAQPEPTAAPAPAPITLPPFVLPPFNPQATK